MDDVFVLIQRDHERVKDLFRRLRKERSEGVPASTKSLRELERQLTVHSRAEEAVFYLALESAPEARALSLEAHVEHRVIHDLLDDLRRLSVGGDEWWTHLFVLEEYVTLHLGTEERKVFPAARRAFGPVLGLRLAGEFAHAWNAEMEAA
jgi:hypothetical protein